MSSSVTLWDVVTLKSKHFFFFFVLKLLTLSSEHISRPRLYPVFYGTTMKLLFKDLCRLQIAFGNVEDCKAMPVGEGGQVKRLKLFCGHASPLVSTKSLSLSVPQFPHP